MEEKCNMRQEAPAAPGAGQNPSMALASMICGILSIPMSCCCCLGWILGGLAVLFAALSRGAGRIRGRAAAGLWTGIAGLVLGTLMTVLWMVMLAGGAV